VPMDATGALQWHVPRAAAAAASVTVALRASALHLQPSFGLVPLAHGALVALRAAAEASGRVRAAFARSVFEAGAAEGVMCFRLTANGALAWVRCILLAAQNACCSWARMPYGG